MKFKKYMIFNHTSKKFEILITSSNLAVGDIKFLPQGKIQIIKLIKNF